MSIRDYKKECGKECNKKPDCNNFSQDDYQKIKNSNPEDVKKIEDIAKSYQGKSESEIMSDIFRIVRQEKAKGSLDNGQINSFANAITPMLNAEQKEKLKDILGKIKE